VNIAGKVKNVSFWTLRESAELVQHFTYGRSFWTKRVSVGVHNGTDVQRTSTTGTWCNNNTS